MFLSKIIYELVKKGDVIDSCIDSTKVCSQQLFTNQENSSSYEYKYF